MITVHIGLSGAGKTYALKGEVHRHVARTLQKTIVIDQMFEWSTVPAFLHDRAACVATWDDAMKAVRDCLLVVVRTSDKPAPLIESACEWALDSRGGVAAPEIQMAAPPGNLSPAIRKMSCAWRHYGASFWADTQRVSLVNRTVIDLAQCVRVFAVAGDRDHAVLRDLGGRELSDAAYDAATKMSEGEPGWHVRLGIVRRGPYELTRYG